MTWTQTYDPLGSPWLSTLAAALPVVVLLGLIAFARIRIHWAALVGLAVALALALFIYRMPAGPALASAAYGGAIGLLPIGWIILNLIFLYQLTVERGLFERLKDGLAGLAPDPRIQVILIAFSFGAFFEGAAGFGTPVAVTAAILISLGFKPLQASGLSLIANTAPVAFGALGTPIITLAKVTNLDPLALSQMVGRQLPFFSLLVPFWVVCAMSGWRGMLGVWPAALTAGAGFAIPQFLVSNFHGPALVDIVASVCSLAATALLLKFWRPRDGGVPLASQRTAAMKSHSALAPWLPWLVLTVCIFVWGVPEVKDALDRISSPKFEVPHLHNIVLRSPPVAPAGSPPEKAIYELRWLSATGSGILAAALVTGLLWRVRPAEWLRLYARTFWRVRFSLLTIAAMLALGHVTKYSGTDATLGLALAKSGPLYPFFGTLLGWLGVALTGSDTASNVLFGGLQKITSQQLGISPILMGAANSSGGVMGKMIDAQSIVVASTATNWYGHEGRILRFVFFHSLALAALVALLVLGQAYWWPWMIPR
jgi:lactate permease